MQTTTPNQTCNYISKENAPFGDLCGQLVSATGKFIGQIRKTNDNEFTVYGWTGIVGKYGKESFKSAGRDRISARKSIALFTLI